MCKYAIGQYLVQSIQYKLWILHNITGSQRYMLYSNECIGVIRRHSRDFVDLRTERPRVPQANERSLGRMQVLQSPRRPPPPRAVLASGALEVCLDACPHSVVSILIPLRVLSSHRYITGLETDSLFLDWIQICLGFTKNSYFFISAYSYISIEIVYICIKQSLLYACFI